MHTSFTRGLLPLLSVLTLAATATAQRTWVVSAAGGPGVDFTDIPPAVAAAANGDVLDVRRGSYGDLVLVRKGLTVIGQAGVTIENLTLTDISATQRVVVTDIVVLGPSVVILTPAIHGCLGTVLLERTTFPLGSRGVRVTDSTDVRISTSRAETPITIARSTASLTDTELDNLNIYSVSSPTLDVVGGTVDISRCTIFGQSEGFGRTFANPAIRLLEGATVRVTDDGSHRIAAGTALLSAQPSAITGNGTVVRDPRVRILAGTAAPVSVTSDVLRHIATLRALGATIGGNVQIELSGLPGEPFALALGFPLSPMPFPQFGGNLGLTPLVVVAQGVLGATPFALQIPVNAGVPTGVTFAWQALAGDGFGGWQFSNHASYARTR